MTFSTSALALALLCLTASTSNAFVSTSKPSSVVTARGEPLSSLVMDRTDVFRPASTHPNKYLPGSPSSSHGTGYGVSSYGPAYRYDYNNYYNNDYDRYNRYGYNGRYSNYYDNRSVNDRSYNSYYNYPSRYGSTYGNNWNTYGRRYNTYGDDYGYSNNNYYNNNRYYNNDYYNNRYSAYGNYGPSYYGSYGTGYGYNDRYNNYYNNWDSSSRNYNSWNGRGTNWATGTHLPSYSSYDLNMDRRGAFEAGSTLSSYSRPSRTSQQLALYCHGNGYSWNADQPRAFSPGYNWRK
jgi:hypothetical protein